MAISRKLVEARIRDNVGESDWDAWDILKQALDYMDDATLKSFYLEHHNSYWEDEE